MAQCGSCYYFSYGRCNYFDISMDEDVSACDHYEGPDSGGGGCFLTSACVEYMNKADDCVELTTLRSFRDGYMASSQEGQSLVKEYYSVAPAIVSKIKSSKNSDEYFKDIYDTICQCVSLINNGENEKTMELYKQMVLKYKQI